MELLIQDLRRVIWKYTQGNSSDYSSRDKSQDTCYLCQEKGHWAPECPQKSMKKNKGNSSDYSSRDKSQDTCYLCQEKGHWAPECPQKLSKKSKEKSNRKRKQEEKENEEPTRESEEGYDVPYFEEKEEPMPVTAKKLKKHRQ